MSIESIKSLKGFDPKSLDRKIIFAAVGVCVLVLAVVVFALIGNRPSDAAIKQAIESELAESWPSAGAYDSEGTWEISSVDIVSKDKKSLEGYFNNVFGDTYYSVVAKVKASNGSAEMDSTVSASFVKYEGSWQLFASPSAESKTYRALQGPDEGKIASNASDVLRVADSGVYSGELQSLYSDSKPEVADVTFNDADQTASAKLAFEHDDAFSSAKGVVNAGFTFENGSWKLTSAKASGGASEVSYDKLLGTWKGTFQSTISHYQYGNCFGAQDKELAIKISSVDARSGKIEGTFQGLVHYHAYLDTDANGSDGDTDSGEIPFVATLSEGETIGRNYGTMQTMLIGADYTAPETTDGEVRIMFGFGTGDDPNAAVAKLYTKANKEKGWNSYCNFEDTYALTKVK